MECAVRLLVRWRDGCETYAKAGRDGKLTDTPTNHNPGLAPVIHPSLQTGVQALVVAGAPAFEMTPMILNEEVLINTLLVGFDLLGTFVFALSGGMDGVKHRLDLFESWYCLTRPATREGSPATY